MIYLAKFIGAMFLSASFAMADDVPAPSHYGRLYQVWKADKQALKDQHVDPSPEQKQELKQRIDDLQRQYATRMFNLAQAHPDDEPTWLGCLVWMTVESPDGEAFDGMIDFLSRKAPEIDNAVQLQLLLSEFADRPSQRIDPMLRRLTDQHSNKGVRGAALYVLGARLKARGEAEGSSELCEEACVILTKVLNEYPDVSTYRGKNSKNAQRLLDELLGPSLGDLAPEIQGTDQHGQEFSLRRLRGKVVVVAFSGHWCGPCRAMHPLNRTLQSTLDSQDFALVEINTDQVRKAVIAKMETDGLKWTCVLDGDTEGPISTAWEIRTWPTYYVLDRELRIRHKTAGLIGDQLTRWVKELIADETMRVK